jgi:hypothetical protein
MLHHHGSWLVLVRRIKLLPHLVFLMSHHYGSWPVLVRRIKTVPSSCFLDVASSSWLLACSG